MLATGRASSGYTLLEILAVLSLIGLLLVLAYPRIYHSEVKTQAKLIGELLASDLRQLREEALTEQTETVLAFDRSGYSLKSGGTKLERNYENYQLTLAIAAPETTVPPEAKVTTEPVSAATVTFKPDGSCNQLVLEWQIKQLRGSLQINETGVLKWSYAPK